MALAPGDCLGPYEILSRIGAGGMGEVWKARDPRLDRVVAIKTAKEQFSERFEREARMIAALNHPHICQIYDVGAAYLVMEYIEGSPVAGPLPPEKAVEYGRQICDALDAAHRKGIVHRDLKPANILISKSGVKVLDFGLARIEQPNSFGGGEETLTQALTQQGAIIGTLQYMAPEQLQGRPADSRADIFSFGCVLHEMLTGSRAFDGASAASVIAAILERPAAPLANAASAGIDWVVQLCLAKNPDQRWQSIHDVGAALQRAAVADVATTSRPPAKQPRAAWIGAGVFALAALAVPALYYGAHTAAAPELRLDIATPPTNSPASFALSPDGRRIAYVATVDGVSRLWVRSLDSTIAQRVAGTEGALNPFWSADGRSLGFVAGLELKRVDLIGGEPQTIGTTAPLAARGTWNADNVIVRGGGDGPLKRDAAAGGQSGPATRLAPGQMVHRAPSFLPGGKDFLFLVNGADPALWVGSLAGTSPRRITAISPGADSAAEYLQSGWLLRVRQNALIAQRFDRRSLEFSGEPITLASPVGVDPHSEGGAFSVSASGAIAWRAGESARRQLIWFDRSGNKIGALGPADPLILNPEISPDNTRVAVTRGRLATSDIWILEGSRSSRFTTDPADDRITIWSPDGKQIVFASNRTGQMQLFRKSADGISAEEALPQADSFAFATSWSPDGRAILYWTDRNGGDIMVLPLTGDRKPFPFKSTRFNEELAVFSPDGKWVAYDCNQSGRYEVYVQPFPGPGPETQVSTGGGGDPRWRSDGKELYFLAPDSNLMAAPVTVRGTAFAAGTPQALFRTHSIVAPGKQQYDVARDGRFLIVTELEDASAEPIHILLNWKPPSK